MKYWNFQVLCPEELDILFDLPKSLRQDKLGLAHLLSSLFVFDSFQEKAVAAQLICNKEVWCLSLQLQHFPLLLHLVTLTKAVEAKFLWHYYSFLFVDFSSLHTTSCTTIIHLGSFFTENLKILHLLLLNCFYYPFFLMSKANLIVSWFLSAHHLRFTTNLWKSHSGQLSSLITS